MTMPTLADTEWLQKVVAAGMQAYDSDGVLHDGTVQAVREQAAAEVGEGSSLPKIITFGPTHAEHCITVVDLDGHPVHLYPKLRWGIADESEWYGIQIRQLKAEMLVVEDKGIMQDYASRIRDYRRDRLQLYFPDLPPNLLSRLDPTQYEHIWTILQRLESDGRRAVVDEQKKRLAAYPEVLRGLGVK